MKLKINAPLDHGFMPMQVVLKEFEEKTAGYGKKIVIGIERDRGNVVTYEMSVYPDEAGHDDKNIAVVERVVKTMLWICGGYRIVIAGSDVIGNKIKESYSKGGAREFDRAFMARVYERDFEVEIVPMCRAPKQSESSESVGRHLKGCRIGFDAGGSDRKVSAVIDGKSVYSEEVVWYPKINSDPSYHYEGIMEAMKTAASHMPRVDSIGVSTAGVCVDNKIMISSLFIKVSDEDFDKRVKHIYTDIAKKLGEEAGHEIPIKIANDGDVTALAGAMSLEAGGVLGIAMGTSEAGGYVDMSGNITGRLNELAFVPVDFNKDAAVDEWSGDYGCGVKYFSQDAVIKLAPAAGIELDESLSPAQKLKVVQNKLEEGHEGARAIFETIGVYFGCAVAYYANFYDINHVLLLGRVSSGKGGDIILGSAKRLLECEYPKLAKKITVSLPDEKSRRVGQSVAAASLPEIS